LPKPFTIVELLDTVKKVLRAANGARIRVGMDFPVIMKTISQIESESPPQYKSQPPADGLRPE
jgi:hypothetical protein